MEKIKIPTTNPFGNGVTQWDDPAGAAQASGSWWSKVLDNMGGILNGAANIVGAANNYDRTTTVNTNTRNVNDTTGHFSFTNGTTITALAIGGIAVIIVLIIVLGRKS